MLNKSKMIRMAIMILLFLIFTVSTLQASTSFRCGNDLVSIGDFSFTVLNCCGEPISKEIIGYTKKDYGLKMEVWVYGPKNGSYYHLTFEGGKLVKIEDTRE